jgi:hypothetical protein
LLPPSLATWRHAARYRMKRTSRAAGSELAEDPVSYAQLTFHNEVDQVVRHPPIVAWCRIHLERRSSRPDGRDRIPTLAGPTELNVHTTLLSRIRDPVRPNGGVDAVAPTVIYKSILRNTLPRLACNDLGAVPLDATQPVVFVVVILGDDPMRR